MITKADATRFIDELREETEVNLSPGINVYFEPPPMIDLWGEGYRISVDPSGLSDYDEERIARYAQGKGLTAEDEWNDWGRFLKVWKKRQSV